jgi:hypothetical protein
MIVRGVDHDAVEPGREAGVAFERVEVPEGLYERFLSDICRIPGVTKGTKRQVVHPAFVPAVELGQGVGIPVAGSFYKMSIGVAYLRGQAQASSLLLKLYVLSRTSHSNRVDYAKVDLTRMRARGEGWAPMPEEDVGVTENNQVHVDEQEAMLRLQEEIGRLSVADHVALMMHSLSSLAVDRLGLGQELGARKDLDQARLAIDGFRALLGALEGKRPAEEIAAHRAALSQLQMAYVGVLEAGDADGAAGGS